MNIGKEILPNNQKTADSRVERVLQWLEDEKIQYELHRHDNQEGVTSKDASNALGGVNMKQILKSLLFQTKDGGFFGVVMTGDRKVSFNNLQKILGQKVSIAKTEDILERTGFERGGVPPFAFYFARIPAYVDKEVMKNSEVFGSAGSSTAGVKFSPTVFKKIKYAIVDIREQSLL